MSFYKFTNNDIFVNQTDTNPYFRFDMYNSKIYYNKQSDISGAFTTNIGNVPTGHISLYDLNVDRNQSATGLIYPFIQKDSSLSSFKSVSTSDFMSLSYGDVITGSYPLSSSITREFFDTNHFATMLSNNRTTIQNEFSFYGNELIQVDSSILVDNNGLPAYETNDYSRPTSGVAATSYQRYLNLKPLLSSSHINSLKNIINSYSIMSKHFQYSASFGPARDLDIVPVNLISIPSIFFGSGIQKGTINLKYYISGSLYGELEDINQNGELIQIGPSGSLGSGSIAGLALYKQGFIILTGSWDLTPTPGKSQKAGVLDYKDTGTACTSSWLFYGVGANDGIPADTAGTGSRASASFSLEFCGTQEVPVMTIFTHAPKSDLNFSNNPTYLKYNSTSSTYRPLTSSISYRELEHETVNVVSSSFTNTSASFSKETYISKIGIYDDNKNLIGIATLAKPVKKNNDREFTFKLKLDL